MSVILYQNNATLNIAFAWHIKGEPNFTIDPDNGYNPADYISPKQNLAKRMASSTALYNLFGDAW